DFPTNRALWDIDTIHESGPRYGVPALVACMEPAKAGTPYVRGFRTNVRWPQRTLCGNLVGLNTFYSAAGHWVVRWNHAVVFFASLCATLRLRAPLLLLGLSLALPLRAQVTLQANGPGNTYELINSTLGGTAEEVP